MSSSQFSRSASEIQSHLLFDDVPIPPAGEIAASGGGAVPPSRPSATATSTQPAEDDALRAHLSELIERGPDAVRMNITPAGARVMLERNHTNEWNNRPASGSGIKRYMRVMREGRWKYTGETIVFSVHGNLLNGQNRLTACVNTGRRFEALVAFHVEDDAFRFMDCGIARTAGHIFAIDGIRNYNFVASTTRLVYRYMTDPAWGGATGGDGSATADNETLLAFFHQHEDIANGFHIAKEASKNRTLALSARWIGMLYYTCASISREQADAFFTPLVTGIGFTNKRSTVYKLSRSLNDLAASRMQRHDAVEQRAAAEVVNAWNAYRTHTPFHKGIWRQKGRSKEPFPRAL